MATILIGGTITATPEESNAAGPVPLVVRNIQWHIADSTIVKNTGIDPTTGVASFQGLAAGTVEITAIDEAFNLSYASTLTVVDPTKVPTSITYTWGTPVAPVA